MNFSKIAGFSRFYVFSSLFRPILPAALDRVGNFTSGMYFWIFFEALGACCIKIKQTRSKNEAKNMENLKN